MSSTPSEYFLNNIRQIPKINDVVHEWDVLPGESILTVNRVSTSQQGKAKSLRAQSAQLKNAVLDGDGKFVYPDGPKWREYKEWSGYGPGYIDIVRKYGDYARETGCTKVAWTSLDRLARSAHLGVTWDAQPFRDDVVRVVEALGPDLIAMTLVHPGTSAEECRAQITAWAGAGAEKNPYPGYKKDRKAESFALVVRLKSKGSPTNCLSLKDISALTGIGRPTVQKWVEEARRLGLLPF